MPEQILIVATEPVAKAPAEVATSFSFTPVITASESEALDLLNRQNFTLIAVSGRPAWQRLRAEAERRQPAARVVELPEHGSDDADVRRLMMPYLNRRRRPLSEERYQFLSRILESFTGTLELNEVLRRIVTTTLEEFGADRALMVHPVTADASTANVRFAATAPHISVAFDASAPVQLTPVLIKRALEAERPIVVVEGDPDANGDLMNRLTVRSAMFQILRPRDDDPWSFAMHQCTYRRQWTEEEISLFAEIGRYATLALNNTLLHERSVREMAKVNAILDQIPESAAIYDATGHLERMNAVAMREPLQMFAPDAEGKLRTPYRTIDGRLVGAEDLPSTRALRGETLRSDYLVHDPRSGDDRVVNLKAAPIRDDHNRIVGSVVLSRDVTDERQNAEREAWRRRRAECLANLGLEAVTVQAQFDNLDDTARRVAESISGSVMIFLYHPQSAEIHMVGMGSVAPTAAHVERYRDYVSSNPYHAGEGVPGTVFQIGRPLLYAEFGKKAAADFARNADEQHVIAAMEEQSLIAAPIDSYGNRIGAVVLARSDDRRTFDAEDVEFAQAVAERIGAAAHIHRLTSMSQEGHRAAEELARTEVDARVRFEAVLETAPIGIAVVSADELRFELANLRWHEYACLFEKIASDTKLVGLRVAEVIPDFEAILKQVAESSESRIDEALEIRTSGAPKYVNRIISAVQGRFSGITQNLTVLIQDVTDQVVEDRQARDREARRRRHAECLANIGLEAVAVESSLENLDEPARRIAQAVGGTAMIYLYHPASSELSLVGFSSPLPAAEDFRRHVILNPFRPGEGLPGTVFQIGRPLFFSDVRGDAVVDYGRDETEKRLKRAMDEQTVIACPIESYGDRIGALVISRSDDKRNFDAEDLEFAQSAAERLGAASHIHRLTRVSQDGHRAAEELARREVDARVRFEAVLENAPVGIAAISADELRFELANARFLDFVERFGTLPPDARVIGLRVAEVIPGFERILKQVAESGEARVDQAYEMAGWPEPVYVNRIVSAVRGRFSGITQSLTILVQDVTDQVRAKREIEDLAQAMAERSARLDSILASMTDGLWVYDAVGSVVSVNEAALTMFGLGSRTEAIEHGSFTKFNLRYPDGRQVPADDLPFARALRGMTVPDYLAIGRHLINGKDIDLSIAAAPIESNGVVGAVLVMRDITALQELDRKKDEFLSVASHELRTPLTTIKGYTQLLSQTITDLPAAEQETYLNAVLGEIDRMMGLISELLDVSRIETNRLQIERQPIRWLEFLERRASAFRVQNPARNITFEGTARETTLLVDPDRMRQVVDNLLSNAIKYSPEGSPIEVNAAIEDSCMLTSVVDRGIGIPADEIPKLFERFHRARNVSSRYYGGLGLGLYIAKAIIEAHSGSIAVASEEGQGATFTIRLPLP
jgi:PAS domain S-box-containing protein